MNIEITPLKLKKLCESVFNAKKSDTSLIVFTPEGVMVNCLLSSDLLVLASFDKSYFATYEVQTNTELMITKTLIDEVNDGIKADKVKLEITPEHFIMSNPAEGHIRVKIEAIDGEKKAPFSMAKTEVGLVAALDGKLSAFNAQMLVPVDKFLGFKDVEFIRMIFDGQELRLEADKELSDKLQKVPIKRILPNAKPFNMMFQFDTLKSLISEFKGDVWISLNDTGISISQINEDYMLSYMFARIAEPTE